MSRSAHFARTLLLALAMASNARAGTFTVTPSTVVVGETLHMAFALSEGALPQSFEGSELLLGVVFNGPCNNYRGFAFPDPWEAYGADREFTLPGPGWSTAPPQCPVPGPGEYVATLTYIRLDASGVTGQTQRIDVPFRVLGTKLEVEAIPDEIPIHDTVLIEVAGLNPGEVVASVVVTCLDGTLDSGVTPTVVTNGFATSWPGAFWTGACDSSESGGHRVTVTTQWQTAETRFRVYGDKDGDGWLDRNDNCPADPNPGQEDADGDNRGDACDADRDNDGKSDDDDNCPDHRNSSQDDLDVDGLGDACDPDIEDDGVPNTADNCDYHWNPGQENIDGDPFGDLCDPDPEDADNDGFNDLVDNCWTVFNPGQQDGDLDGIGTACDPDIDGDGIPNDDEWAAGTDPLDYQPIGIGINEFFDGQPVTSEIGVPEGEPVGVVVNPATTSTGVDVTIVDPWGGVYGQQTLIPHSPVTFWFVPIWPGAWRIDADANNGETFSSTIHVIPESGAPASAITAMLALGLAARRASARGTA